MAHKLHDHAQWRLALVSEQYAPDLSSTAQLFEELVKQFLASGAEVRVCTMTPGYVANAPKAPWREKRNGVHIWRAPRLPFARTNRFGEALNWIWGVMSMAAMALFVPRRIPLLIGTNPPMAHIIGALMKVLKGQRYIALFYDLHPELSCAVGMLRPGSLIDRMWRRINTWALRHADYAICLGTYMEKTVKARWPAARTIIIPNWCDPNLVHVLPKTESQFAQQHQLHDKFVVLFSGNMGWRQRLEILLDVAEKMLDAPIRFVFIGEGAKKNKLVESAKARGLHNVLFFPYQPRTQMEHSLAAADVAVVSQEREVIGCGVPSKIYTNMASGRALLGLASQPCELTDLIREVNCGWNFDEDHDADAIAEKLRELIRNPSEAIKAGQRARRYFEQHFTLQIAAAKYEKLIKELNQRGPAPSLFAPWLPPWRSCRPVRDHDHHESNGRARLVQKPHGVAMQRQEAEVQG
ncbi:MAG: glycosyltransferase family 4 protein [candidate division KSB1 bacterium]|nr:glycosyltransferase family 4 protein [candidate division KSB1 bacterium]MDZ7301490.1 glycosyltransferase family 4 protein [candidate division KSB1 bacterium]MDZ7310892.1 glycosyltransferase family 4 protein [candidate division KSB1 bacterium]